MNKPLNREKLPISHNSPQGLSSKKASTFLDSKAAAILAMTMAVMSPNNASADEPDYAPDGSIYHEDLNRYDFKLRLEGFSTPYCFGNNSDNLSATCLEFDPSIEFTRVLTRNERLDGRVDGDEDNELEVEASLRLNVRDFNFGLISGLNSNLGNATDYFTGLDVGYRNQSFELQAIYVPANLSQSFAPYKASVATNFMLSPDRFSVGLGGGLTTQEQEVNVGDLAYTVNESTVTWLNLNTEFKVSPDTRFCAGVGFDIGLSQPDTFGFSLTLSNCSHLYDRSSADRPEIEPVPVVMPIPDLVTTETETSTVNQNPQTSVGGCSSNILPVPTTATDQPTLNCDSVVTEPEGQVIIIPVKPEVITIPIQDPEPPTVVEAPRVRTRSSRPTTPPVVTPPPVVTVPPIPNQRDCVRDFIVCMEQQSTEQVRIDVSVQVESCLQGAAPESSEFAECVLPNDSTTSEHERICREMFRDSFIANICQ